MLRIMQSNDKSSAYSDATHKAFRSHRPRVKTCQNLRSPLGCLPSHWVFLTVFFLCLPGCRAFDWCEISCLYLYHLSMIYDYILKFVGVWISLPLYNLSISQEGVSLSTFLSIYLSIYVPLSIIYIYISKYICICLFLWHTKANTRKKRILFKRHICLYTMHTCLLESRWCMQTQAWKHVCIF